MYPQKSIFVLIAIYICCVICYQFDVVPAGHNYSAAFDQVVVQVKGSLQRSRKSSDSISETTHNFSIVGDEFMMDGQRLHIVAGSLHYFRLPSAYWRDRLRKLKAAGLNSVSTYVEWSFHEPEERKYSFERSRDIARFVRIAAEEGLYVLLRPGPYICAERDLGGFPYWLLSKYPYIKLRSTNKDFINETKIWMAKLFEQLTPLLFGNGGPIILVQVENEYGSYGKDRAYMELIRDILLEHVRNDAILYTTDGSSEPYFTNGMVSRALTTIDFGTGNNVRETFKLLRRYMPHGPLMNSEYYPGWLTHWGETLQQVPTEPVVKTLCDMLDNNINLNFYMFFGGTNFEFSAGANYDFVYQSDITSYDYDAPLSEAGDPTPKYYAIREALEKYNLELKNTSVPTPSPKGAYGPVTVNFGMNLLSREGRSAIGKKYEDVMGTTLPTFEKLRQRAGLVLYETTLNETDGLITVTKPRDRVYVYVDGQLQGVISRMHKIYSVPITSKPGSVLSLLVENQGRINFGYYIHDFKGILSIVKHNNQSLSGQWSVTGYPLEVFNAIASNVTSKQMDLKQGPELYDGFFTLPKSGEPLDTFLDTTGWGKGYIWINGYNLGRYWPAVGPQVTLYVPGVWLRAPPTKNYIQILELEEAPSDLTVQFVDYPILNRTISKNKGNYMIL